MMNGFAEHAIVKNTFDEASAILGQDLWAMINGSDAEIIGQTVNTQPIMLRRRMLPFTAPIWKWAAKRLPPLPDTASANTPRLSPPKHWILPMPSNSSACAPN